MNLKKYITVLALAALGLSSCQDSKRFYVGGNIAGAAGDTVYLYREGLDSVVVCDSAVVAGNGAFKMKAHRPLAPDFYSLRVDSLSLWLVVDSTEHITVNTDKQLKQCAIKGSPESTDLQKWLLYIKQMDDSLTNVVEQNRDDRKEAEQRTYALVNGYKDTVAGYIQHNASSMVSYYLLFKNVAFGLSPFSAFAPEDRRAFAMVANAHNKLYPASLRTQQLKAVMDDVVKLRSQERFLKATASTAKTGFVDLEYPDAHGKMVKLSSKKGKEVLLLFCYLPQMGDEVMNALRQLHTQYRNKGFDIYMVTFDKNKEAWKKMAAELPWTVVLDENETSPLTYNFQQLPSNYFIARDGGIIGRDVSLQEVAAYFGAK